MPPSTLQHRRTHNLLLISRLLNQRDVSSPFTLVLDSLEQSGKPLVGEYLRRAGNAKVQTVFVSFETLKKPKNVDVFLPAWSLGAKKWQSEVAGHLKAEPGQRKLLILDTLNPLASTSPEDLPGVLSSFISPTTSLLAIYHADIPLPTPSTSITQDPYAPAPLTLLRYLATTIFTTHCFHHVLERKKARGLSRVEPVFGLEEGVEGVVLGLGANGAGAKGVVLEMEHRRKSGRGVREWYFLPSPKMTSGAGAEGEGVGRKREVVSLLEDHPDYRSPEKEWKREDEQAQEGSTFELGLSDRQRQDREGVVLPYFDAQKGGGEGGRILYDMGSEDDFDEEEDEI